MWYIFMYKLLVSYGFSLSKTCLYRLWWIGYVGYIGYIGYRLTLHSRNGIAKLFSIYFQHLSGIYLDDTRLRINRKLAKVIFLDRNLKMILFLVPSSSRHRLLYFPPMTNNSNLTFVSVFRQNLSSFFDDKTKILLCEVLFYQKNKILAIRNCQTFPVDILKK